MKEDEGGGTWCSDCEYGREARPFPMGTELQTALRHVARARMLAGLSTYELQISGIAMTKHFEI